jgi:hypothetical protein
MKEEQTGDRGRIVRLVELDWSKATALPNSSIPAKGGSRAGHLEDKEKDHRMGSMLNCTTSVKLPVITNTSAML